MKHTIAVVAVHVALVAAAFLTMAPLLWMVSASLMPAGESTTLPLRFLPSAPTLEHYRALFERMSLGRHLWSSTVVATSATVISLLLNSMAGYAFAKLHFPGRERVFQALLAALVIPAQVSMLPLFLLLKEMGIVNTYLAAIVPGMASIFGIFLVRQFAMAIPDTLLDAARIDGAGELRIYWSLVLPFCRPVLVTLAVFTFLGTWNDFLWPLIVLADDDLYTLPVALANLLGEHAQDTELMMAGAVLTVVPVLALFIALQRQYVAGIMAGALKE
jgi:multiple sugar transport system permease protein